VFSHRPSIMRLAVVGGAILGIAWATYSVSIAPLQRSERELLGTLTDRRERIDAARKTIEEIKQQEQATAGARAELQRLHRDLPAGSVMSWFPSRMKQHFDRLGISDSVTRLNNALDEPEMPGYQRTYWAVDLPIQGAARDISSLLIAVAELEKAEPIVKVIDLAIRQDDDSHRIAVINVTALVRK
jgi:hypothetical protein